jgi:Flp pilus assembly pilin Flp
LGSRGRCPALGEDPRARGSCVASHSPHFQEEERFVKNLVVRFLHEESGEDLIEYGLLCAFVAAVATAVIIADPLGIRTSLINAYKRAKTALDNS